jgi:single-strand DNA-binding protein
MDTNVVVLVGRSTRDVEVRYVGEKNTAVATLGLAINGRRNGENEEVTFVDVTLWGRTAEVASEWAGKGKQVAVTGRLRQETWEHEGQKRSKIVVVAENLQLLGGNNAANEASNETAQGETPPTGGEAPKRGRGRPKAEKPANVGVPDDEVVPF